MTLVLLPDHEGKQRPVAFFSRKLPVDTDILNCLRALAASDKTGIQGFSRILPTHPADPKRCVYDAISISCCFVGNA